MTEELFDCRLNTKEKLFGWIMLPIYVLGSGFILRFIYRNILAPMGVTLTNADANLWVYIVTALLILLFMHRFLRSSFDPLLDDFGHAIGWILACYGLLLMMNGGVNTIKGIILGEATTNPNQAAIEQMVITDLSKTVATTVLLAPIVEECLFRGAVYGPLREKSRVLAWVVTVALFAFYHLWQSFVFDYDPRLWIELLDYVPGGIALCLCYEKTRSIWGPIFMHMLTNGVAMWAISTMAG